MPGSVKIPVWNLETISYPGSNAGSVYEIVSGIYNILRYVIASIYVRHMCNLHIKETEISQKRSKGIKN